MGNGRRRSISCPSCNGQADGNKLLAPVALACGIDGSLYVGDFNYVRRIFPSGNVTSVLIGASSSKQIKENVNSLNNINFSKEEIEKIDKILG